MIYIVKPNGDVLGSINGLKEESCNLKRILTDMWELSFEVTKYIDVDGNFELSDYYDSISEKIQLRLETDLVDTMFVIDSEPSISNDGIQETKIVTAHTTECELQYKFLRLFYINNGTPTSKEYLATDNINSYTQLPNEYISLVNFDNHELSLLHLVLEGTEWTVDENLKETESEMCAKKFAFSIDEQDIYTFLTDQIANTAQIIFFFDRKNRVVSFKSFKNLGEDTGIFIGLRNLANQIDIESTSESGLITKYKPTCSENLGVEYVNFGDPYIYNLDYFANTYNEYGDYKYVTESFHDEYIAWTNKRASNRQSYINLTKEYNANLIKINELKNRLPNDGCSIDYKTYKADELYLSLNAYENAVATLITLYKADFPEKYTNPSIALDETHLKSTMYWNDYYSYKYQIIPSVKEAMKIWYQTDNYGNLSVGNDGKYILCENGNPSYASNVDIVKPIDSYKYEFALYGLDELQSKKKAWLECVNLLYKDGFVLSGTKENPTQYNTPDDAGWNRLTASQKLQFTNISAFKENLNNYLDYMSIGTRNNSITGTNCKGIIRQCDDAIIQRQSEINSLVAANNTVQNNRNLLSSTVIPENNFSPDNIKIFRLLIHEENYTNENIVTTSLDDIVSTIDVAEELYQDAINQLSIVSQPQHSFKTTIDNLFSLEEFSSYKDDFEIGNFIKLLPDFINDDFVKLRVISIELNPLIETSDITVEFSTMTKSLSDINDIAFLFDSNNRTSSGSNTGSSNSSGGTYGKNDAEIQIANNMLNALLKTETFGTQVSDIILDSIRANSGNFGKLFAHSGIFDSLEAGQIKVSGDSIFDRIKSTNWNGSENYLLDNTIGSIIDLYNGYFSFAGGKLRWDGKSLIVEGTLNGCDGNFRGSINVNDNFVVDDKGNVTAHGSLTATDAYIKGNIEATNSVISKSVFIDGDIKADTLNVKTTGNIAGWTFDENGFYKNNNTIGQESGAYIGNDGISISDYFIVNDNGVKLRSKDLDYTYDSELTDLYPYESIDSDSSVQIVLNHIETGNNICIKIRVKYYYSKTDNSISWKYLYRYIYVSVKENSVKYISVDAGNGNIYASRDEKNNTLTLYIKGYLIDNIKFGDYDNNYIPDDFKNKYEHNELVDIYTEEKEYDNVYYNKSEIKETSVIKSGSTLKKYYGNMIDRTGLIIDTEKNEITFGNYVLNPELIHGYRDFKICISNGYLNEPLLSNNNVVIISNDSLFHNGLQTSSSGNNIISSGGYFYVKSSSSKRYKNSIICLSDKVKSHPEMNPHNLYDINVVSFQYNDDYLQQSDQRYHKDIPGFIAEDVYEKYPIACNLDSQGNPEMWDINIMFPAALKLIQEQYEEIEQLKQRIEILEQKVL